MKSMGHKTKGEKGWRGKDGGSGWVLGGWADVG